MTRQAIVVEVNPEVHLTRNGARSAFVRDRWEQAGRAMAALRAPIPARPKAEPVHDVKPAVVPARVSNPYD